MARAPANNELIETTIRSFDGGWNVIDTDLNMLPKFAKVLDNLERSIDGTLALRPGTRLLSTLPLVADLVNCFYFNNFVVAVQNTGNMTTTDGTGIVASLAKLWGATTYCTSTMFSNRLMLHNGVNKPIVIEGNVGKPNYMVPVYLQDPGSGSNVNTPIGSFAVTHGQYHVVAGLSAAPSSIAISARGAPGTFYGDPAPNDAVVVDLGPRVSMGSATITGLVSYRDKLLVTFERGVLPINLGVYSSTVPAVHTPSDDGFIEEWGCLSHRSLVSVGDDTFFCDNIGVNSIERLVLYNTLRPQRASQLIDPAITALIQPLTPAQIAQYVFAVYDMRHRRYMLFVPVFNDTGGITETVAFSYTDIPVMKIQAWARLRGWCFSCACRTALQNVVFGWGNKLYTYDFASTMTNADYIGDTDKVADGSGVPIAFDWELPWADFKHRKRNKITKYLALDVRGSAEFTASMYVDNIRMDKAGVDAPMLRAEIWASGQGGFGAMPFGVGPFGGRLASDERTLGWPAKFNLAKLRFHGSTKLPLQFVSVTVLYQLGMFQR